MDAGWGLQLTRRHRNRRKPKIKLGIFSRARSVKRARSPKRRGELRGLTIGGHGVVAGGVGNLGSTVSTSLGTLTFVRNGQISSVTACNGGSSAVKLRAGCPSAETRGAEAPLVAPPPPGSPRPRRRGRPQPLAAEFVGTEPAPHPTYMVFPGPRGPGEAAGAVWGGSGGGRN